MPVSGPDLGFFLYLNASIPGIFRVLSVLQGRAGFPVKSRLLPLQSRHRAPLECCTAAYGTACERWPIFRGPLCAARACLPFSQASQRLPGPQSPQLGAQRMFVQMPQLFHKLQLHALKGRMGKIKLFPTTEYSSKQPSDPVVPLVPCTGIFLGPSKSGKTVALISLILEQYRGVFERIYIFSPSVNIDDGWIPVKKYIEEDLGVNTEREQTYWDEWDEAALRRIIQQQRKITEASKKLEMKKLYQVLVVIDDFADTPQLHKPHGALDTLFIRGRHMQISTWVSSQKLRPEAEAHQRRRAGQHAIFVLLEAAQPARAGCRH